MIFSHVLSSSVLAATGVGVFWHFFGRVALLNRLLWGFFLLTTALAALIGVIHYTGYQALEPLHESMRVLSNSLGVVCVVTATYLLLTNQRLSRPAFVVLVTVGLLLFVALLLPDVRVFRPIVPSLGILILMLIAVFALLQRNKRGLWIVLAAMLLGLATKAASFNALMDSTDFDHYVNALALWFFGKAAEHKG